MLRALLLTGLIWSLHMPAWAMEQYVNVVQDRQGNALPGTKITVYLSGTTTLATLYSDNGITGMPNPFINNANGSFAFFADNGLYTLHFERSGTDFSTSNSNYTRIALFDPTDFTGIAGGGLDANFDVAREIDGATPATPVEIGNGTQKIEIYGDPTEGGVVRPNPLGNTPWRIWPGFSGCARDMNAGADMFCYQPGAGSKHGMYLINSPYRPLGTITWDAGAINTDGTNCTPATEQALNSSAKTWALSCADSNSSIMSGKVKMPGNYDGGTVQFTLSLFHGTTETITFAGAFSARCRGLGDSIDGTYGTAQSANIGITTANKVVEATTVAVTPDGTCAAGKFISWRYVVDSANFSTNAANSKVLSVTMIYSKDSWSH